jgi:hypothetical protein
MPSGWVAEGSPLIPMMDTLPMKLLHFFQEVALYCMLLRGGSTQLCFRPEDHMFTST